MKQKKEFSTPEIFICSFNAEYDVITASGDAANEQGLFLGNDKDFWLNGGGI